MMKWSLRNVTHELRLYADKGMLRLHKIVRTLWFYAVIYAAIITLFALVFTPMSGEFYHSAIAFEPQTKIFEHEIERELERDIKRNISPESPGAPVFGLWQLHIWVYDIRLQGEWLLARTNIYAISQTTQKRFEVAIDLRISTEGSINTPIYKPLIDENGKLRISRGHPIYYVRKADVSVVDVHVDRVEGLPLEASEFFPCRSYPVGLSKSCIETEKELDEKITALVHLLSGQPEPGQGAFWRMLYFSVSTITTLGFGDIVPVTPLARALVTLEALLGPLLLGFFLVVVGSRLAANVAASSSIRSSDSPQEKVQNQVNSDAVSGPQSLGTGQKPLGVSVTPAHAKGRNSDARKD
jgi:hypothetical protein